jgi:hypothetical protein
MEVVLRHKLGAAVKHIACNTRSYSLLTIQNSRATTATLPLFTNHLRAKFGVRGLATRSIRDAPEGLKPWQILGLRIFGYFGPASTRIRQAQAIYRSCTYHAESPSLRRELQLPNDAFASRHQLTVIHVWIVNKRLIKERSKSARKLQSELFDTFWENTERRIRQAGIAEMSVSKNMGEVQKITFGAMVSYDIGLKTTDDKDHELASAVWRNLFASQESVPDELVYRVARWMRSEVDRVVNLPLSQVEEGDLEWTLPDGSQVTEEDRKQLIEKGLDGEWRSAIAVDGKQYWWNTKTRESKWEKPKA